MHGCGLRNFIASYTHEAETHTNHHPHPLPPKLAGHGAAPHGRHCTHCDKTVVDFTGYTDAQLLTFFAKSNTPTCGRFSAHQLHRTLHLPPQPHSRLYRLFVALGLTLVFTQVPEARARVYAPITIATTNEQTTDSGKTAKLSGVVVDENGEPVIGAVVLVFQDLTNKGGAATDFDGAFSFSVPTGDYHLTISNYWI